MPEGNAASPPFVIGEKKILVVDDEEDLREMIAFAFQLEGFQTRMAANGRDAFAIAEKEAVDIVISDVRMPDGDGIELLQNLQKLIPRLPLVILTTGFSDLRLEEAFDWGAEALFIKPFALHELIGCVNRLLSYADPRFSGRRDTRVAYLLEMTVTLTSSPGKPLSGRSLNLSRGGIFAEFDGHYPNAGERVFIRFHDTFPKTAPIEFEGIVAWIKKDFSDTANGCGIVFVDPQNPFKTRYFELLNAIKTTRLPSLSA